MAQVPDPMMEPQLSSRWFSYVIGICFILVGPVSVAGSKQPTRVPSDLHKARELAANLSWNAVGFSAGFVAEYYPQGPVAEALVKIGKPATEALLDVLENPEQGVAAHLILLRIWFPDGVEGRNMHYIWENKSLLGWDATYWDLTWSWRSKSGHSVDTAALKRIANKWRKNVATR